MHAPTTPATPSSTAGQVSKAILGDKKPLTTRPSAALPPADFAAVKAELQGGRCGEVLGTVTDELVVSSLLYPKVNTAVPVFFVVLFLLILHTSDIDLRAPEPLHFLQILSHVNLSFFFPQDNVGSAKGVHDL